MPTVYLGRRHRLSASHRLFCPEWDELRNQEVFGKCANPHGHGHNYVVEVIVGGPLDSASGMVFDLAELDRVLLQTVVEPFDQTNLNLHPAFVNRVPTSENFAIEIFERISAALPIGTLSQVRLVETPKNSFLYTGGRPLPGQRARIAV